MVEQTFKTTANTAQYQLRKTSVWRDGALGLAASVGVGILTGTALTGAVFAMAAVIIGQ